MTALPISVIISLRSAYDYIVAELDKYGGDPDFSEIGQSCLNLIVKCVVNPTAFHETSGYDHVVSTLESLGIDHDQAVVISRTLESIVVSSILTHIPDFGSDHYYGQTSVRFHNDTTIVVQIDPAAHLEGARTD